MTTTLKLTDELKVRISPLTAGSGKTPHAWMVDAIQAQVALSDLKASFIQEGRESATDIDAGAPLHAMEDVAAYLRGRLANADPARPMPLARSDQDRRPRLGKKTR